MTGRELRRLRLRAGYSQEQLAAKVRCAQSTVSRAERGRGKIPVWLAFRAGRILR